MLVKLHKREKRVKKRKEKEKHYDGLGMRFSFGEDSGIWGSFHLPCFVYFNLRIP
jgi:hypothetical protein